jgi:hypothetical protein
MSAERSDDDGQRIAVEISQQCHSGALLYRGQLPGLVLNDGVAEVIWFTGPKFQNAWIAKEFAIGLAANALAFAGACNRRLVDFRPWSPDDPELD